MEFIGYQWKSSFVIQTSKEVRSAHSYKTKLISVISKIRFRRKGFVNAFNLYRVNPADRILKINYQVICKVLQAFSFFNLGNVFPFSLCCCSSNVLLRSGVLLRFHSFFFLFLSGIFPYSIWCFPFSPCCCSYRSISWPPISTMSLILRSVSNLGFSFWFVIHYSLSL